MKKNTNIIAIGLYALFIFLLGMTPIGIVPIGFVNLTILHVFVVVGAILFSRGGSILFGFAFGFSSILSAFGFSLVEPSGVAVTLLEQSSLALVATSMLPRLLMPIVTWIVYDILSEIMLKGRLNSRAKYSLVISIAVICGCLTNSAGYLLMMRGFYNYYGLTEQMGSIFSSSLYIGIGCELLAALLIASPVVITLRYKSRKGFTLQLEEQDIDEEMEPVITSSDRYGEFTGVEETENSELDTEAEEEEDMESMVIVIPSVEYLLPKLDEAMQKRHDKCIQYLDYGNVLAAEMAFDAFCSYFNDEKIRFNVQIYVVLCLIRGSKYRTAALRLAKLIVVMPGMSSEPENKKTLSSLIVMINSSSESSIKTALESKNAQLELRNAVNGINRGMMNEAAQAIEALIEYSKLEDRVIERLETDVYDDIKPAAIFCVEQQNNAAQIAGDFNEGVDELNISNVPTAISICVELQGELNVKKAYDARRAGYGKSAVFDDVISAAQTPEQRLKVELLVVLTSFELSDYPQAMLDIINMLKRGYDKQLLTTVNPAIDSVLTIIHMTAINLCESKEAMEYIDKLMQKAKSLNNDGAFMLSAQILDKYFTVSGLAKYC